VDPGILREETVALVGELGGAEVRSIVLTHADWDHILGPEHLAPAPIVAHKAYAGDLDPEGARAVLARLEEHAGVARERPFDPPLPDTTFGGRLTLLLGELELVLEHAPGHTTSMLTIYEPQEQTLWAADLLSDVEIPSIIDDLARYESTLSRIASLALSTVVPGHGNPSSEHVEIEKRLDEDRRYLDELRTSVEAAVSAGASLEETSAHCEAISLRRSPDDDATHRLNVEKVYADLGGDANPEEVGYVRAWKEATRS
jgi:glyoxylase-like metal-dependent hydrolase (beta-lactamase superfamily II)